MSDHGASIGVRFPDLPPDQNIDTMNQETEKRTRKALRKLRSTLTKQGAELGLALNECEEASDDFELCNDKLYEAAVGVWFAVNETIEKIGKTLNNKES